MKNRPCQAERNETKRNTRNKQKHHGHTHVRNICPPASVGTDIHWFYNFHSMFCFDSFLRRCTSSITGNIAARRRRQVEFGCGSAHNILLYYFLWSLFRTNMYIAKLSQSLDAKTTIAHELKCKNRRMWCLLLHFILYPYVLYIVFHFFSPLDGPVDGSYDRFLSSLSSTSPSFNHTTR